MNWSRCQLPTPFTKCPNCKNEAQKEETRTGVQGTPPCKTSHLRAIPSPEQANSEIPALTLCYQPRGPPGPGVSGPGPRSRLRSGRRVRMLKEIQPRLFLPARQGARPGERTPARPPSLPTSLRAAPHPRPPPSAPPSERLAPHSHPSRENLVSLSSSPARPQEPDGAGLGRGGGA